MGEKADEVRLKYDLATNFLDDAISSRHIEFNPSPQGIRIYKLYKIPWFRYLLYLAFIIDVGLAFFEAPAAPGWLWPSWVTIALELVCVTFFMARLFHEMMVCVSAKIFWKDTKVEFTIYVYIFSPIFDQPFIYLIVYSFKA